MLASPTSPGHRSIRCHGQRAAHDTDSPGPPTGAPTPGRMDIRGVRGPVPAEGPAAAAGRDDAVGSGSG